MSTQTDYPRVMFSGPYDSKTFESIGIPARDSPLWKDEEYCDSIRLRYEWLGLDLTRYIEISDHPPTVPEYWLFSKCMLYGNEKTAVAFRDELHKTLRDLGAEIQLVDSNWHWSIDYCEGPHYVHADMFIFMSKGEPIADLNRLSGNRYAWSKLFINAKERRPAVPYDYDPVPSIIMTTRPSLKSSGIGPQILRMSGKPEEVLPYLESQDPNVVRTAMFRLSYFDRAPIDCTPIQRWLTKPLHGFLERETAKHAAVVMQKQCKL
jgi:hypothetical protein